MSATIGTGLSRTISRSARVEASSGVETRTMSAPASAAAWTWATVAATSVVGVGHRLHGDRRVAADRNVPTMMRRDGRRAMLRQGRMGLCVIGGPVPVSRVRHRHFHATRQCGGGRAGEVCKDAFMIDTFTRPRWHL
jgi:hypothetical protein